MKNRLCKVIHHTSITAGKSKAFIPRPLNMSVSMIHETSKVYKEWRRQMTVSLRKSKSKESLQEKQQQLEQV